ncbi:MAG: SycD/LcrH family type III secretion system chaperone [Desulfovibrionaceae bacterium]|nr:SycD/LcrH family type III secretion system chaperone [Desulfovibrionaceae bacterium]
MEEADRIVQQLKTKVLECAKGFGLPEDHLEEVCQAILGGEPLYTIVGMDRSSIEARYALASQCYQVGKYSDAEPIFRWLCMYEGNAERNWLGLAATLQAEKKYEEAREMYQITALMSGLENPAPFYYSGICFLRENNSEDAVTAFQTVLTLGDSSNREHAVLIDRAKALLKSLTKADA